MLTSGGRFKRPNFDEKKIVDIFGEIRYYNNMMKTQWILKDGAKRIECSSFPYAFRSLWNIRNRGVNPNPEKGDVKRSLPEMMKSLSILSPLGKTYGYAAACQMATDQGLLTRDGEINSREFKKPRNY
jgi:hypothetical protein